MAWTESGRRPRRFGRLCLSAVVLLACGLGPRPARAIQGGAAASVGDPLARATVGIGSVTLPDGMPRLSRCSGILIGPDQVLTAAHCVAGSPAGVLVVFYRGSEPVKPVYTASVAARFSPDRGALTSNLVEGSLLDLSLDLAVLRLSQPVRDRVPVPVVTDASRVPASLQLAGIGLSGRTGGRLRTTVLRPVATAPGGLTLAVTKGSRVCYGDSGGPVVGRDRRGVYVYGVASAVIARNPPCGTTLVVAPAAQLFSGFR